MGMRPLSSACVSLLLEAGADPLRTYEGRSALELARQELADDDKAIGQLEAACNRHDDLAANLASRTVPVREVSPLFARCAPSRR